MLNKNPETFSIIDFELPKLQGENLDEHFKSISQDQSKVYFDLLSTLVKNNLPPLPPKEVWVKRPGWTKYVYKNLFLKTYQYFKINTSIVLSTKFCFKKDQKLPNPNYYIHLHKQWTTGWIQKITNSKCSGPQTTKFFWIRPVDWKTYWNIFLVTSLSLTSSNVT